MRSANEIGVGGPGPATHEVAPQTRAHDETREPEDQQARSGGEHTNRCQQEHSGWDQQRVHQPRGCCQVRSGLDIAGSAHQPEKQYGGGGQSKRDERSRGWQWAGKEGKGSDDDQEDRAHADGYNEVEGHHPTDIRPGAILISRWTEDVNWFAKHRRVDGPHEEEHAERHSESPVIARGQPAGQEDIERERRQGEKPLIRNRPETLPQPIAVSMHPPPTGGRRPGDDRLRAWAGTERFLMDEAAASGRGFRAPSPRRGRRWLASPAAHLPAARPVRRSLRARRSTCGSWSSFPTPTRSLVQALVQRLTSTPTKPRRGCRTAAIRHLYAYANPTRSGLTLASCKTTERSGPSRRFRYGSWRRSRYVSDVHMEAWTRSGGRPPAVSTRG